MEHQVDNPFESRSDMFTPSSPDLTLLTNLLLVDLWVANLFNAKKNLPVNAGLWITLGWRSAEKILNLDSKVSSIFTLLLFKLNSTSLVTIQQMLHQDARYTYLLVLQEASSYTLTNYLPPSEGEEGKNFMQPIWRTCMITLLAGATILESEEKTKRKECKCRCSHLNVDDISLICL